MGLFLRNHLLFGSYEIRRGIAPAIQTIFLHSLSQCCAGASLWSTRLAPPGLASLFTTLLFRTLNGRTRPLWGSWNVMQPSNLSESWILVYTSDCYQTNIPTFPQLSNVIPITLSGAPGASPSGRIRPFWSSVVVLRAPSCGSELLLALQ